MLFLKSVMPFFMVSSSLPKFAVLPFYPYMISIIILNSTPDLPISGAIISFVFNWIVTLQYYVSLYCTAK